MSPPTPVKITAAIKPAIQKLAGRHAATALWQLPLRSLQIELRISQEHCGFRSALTRPAQEIFCAEEIVNLVFLQKRATVPGRQHRKRNFVQKSVGRNVNSPVIRQLALDGLPASLIKLSAGAFHRYFRDEARVIAERLGFQLTSLA